MHQKKRLSAAFFVKGKEERRMIFRRMFLAATGLCAFGVISAEAQVMDFESFNPDEVCRGPSQETLMEGGLMLSADFEEWCVFGPDGDGGRTHPG